MISLSAAPFDENFSLPLFICWDVAVCCSVLQSVAVGSLSAAPFDENFKTLACDKGVIALSPARALSLSLSSSGGCNVLCFHGSFRQESKDPSI